MNSHELLLRLYAAAIERARPEAPTARGVYAMELGTRPVHVVAVGKAAHEMARGALAALAEHGVDVAGGVVVAAHEAESPHPRLVALVGDHPVPGERSLAAADAVGRAVDAVRDGDVVLVLVSGGTTSLIGAPLPGHDLPSLARLFTRVLGAGIDIVAMNAERRRVLRWADGRLGRALAERGARVECVIASDVPGDDVATIGSGPCALADDAPEVVRARVANTVVVSGRDVANGVLAAAFHRGVAARLAMGPLAGEAAEMGVRVADALLIEQRSVRDGKPHVLVWVGETSVRLDGAQGTGGRSQELALAAALALQARGTRGVTLLAAGTDGRDGPTDSAGAIVDAGTVARAARRSRDAREDLANHDSHAALAAAEALIPARHTGANAADVCIGLVE